MPSVLAACSFSRNAALYDISSPHEAACMQIFKTDGAGATQVGPPLLLLVSELMTLELADRSSSILPYLNYTLHLEDTMQ